MSAFRISLREELAANESRVNARASIVAERAAALRWRLDRVDENVCDGYTTEATPGYEAGVPIEVKAVRIRHHDGTGRLGVHVDSHEKLEEAGGSYAVVLYAEVDHGEDRRIVALAMDTFPAGEVGRFVKRDGAGEYQKVRWDLLFDPEAVDGWRWGE